ncbi:MAG: LPS export ABC transporter periplasmic protein LptC [bacterium]
MTTRRLAAALVPTLLSFAACTKKGSAPPVATHATLADSAEQVLFTTHSLLTDKGVARGEMFADTVFVFDENTRFELRKVRVTFNTATGAKDGIMTADRGRYNVRQQVLEGFGHVVVVTNDGRRLTSPQLKYQQALNEISSDSSFTIVKPGSTFSGIGFKADPQLNHFQSFKSGSSKGSFTFPAQ